MRPISLFGTTALSLLLASLPTPIVSAQCTPGPHSGTITADQTWCLADSPHASDSVTVPPGVTLTIQAGAEVDLNFGATLTIEGRLVAQGTAAQPVTFTGGHWQLAFSGGTGSLAYANILNAGFGRPGITASGVPAPGLVLDHCTVGPGPDGLAITDSKVTLTNTTITGISETYGFGAGPVGVQGASSVLSLSNNTFSENTTNQIYLASGAMSDADFTLVPQTGLDGYALPDYTIPSGRTVTLAAGVTLLPTFGATLTIQGRLVAQGTAAQPVTFTSGHWALVFDGGTGDLAGCVISNAGFNRPGISVINFGVLHLEKSRVVGSGGPVYAAAGTVTLVNTVISDSGVTALQMTGGSTLNAVHTTLARLPTAASIESASTATFTNTIVAGSPQGWGVVNDGTATVTMTHTLWDNVARPTSGTVTQNGLLTGPAAFAADGYHLTQNSLALGQGIATAVSDDIDGEARPQPAHTFLDLGADEAPWAAPLNRTATPINLGQTVSGTASNGTYVDYVLNLAEGQAANLVVKLTPAGGTSSWGLYGRLGAFPYTTLYDLEGVSRPDGTLEMLIPAPEVGAWYFSVLYSNQAGGNAAFQLQVRAVDRFVGWISPSSGGNTGSVTAQIAGLGFASGLNVQLRTAGVTVRTAAPVAWDETALSVQLDLTGLAPQAYDVCVVWPDAFESCLAGAFTVQAGGSSNLVAQLVVPAQARIGRPTTIFLDYSNAGTEDMPAPYFVIVSVQNVQQRLDRVGPWQRAPISILGLDRDALGTAGTLAPGKSYRVPIQVIPEGAAHVQLQWLLYVLPSDSAVSVNWSDQEASMRPADVPDAAWARIWPAYQADMGSTWAAVQHALRRTADAISETGQAADDPKRLALARLQVISGENISGPQAREDDIIAGGPGVTLSFSRTYPVGLPARFRVGPLGYGWTHSSEMSIQELSSGEAVVKQGAAEWIYVPVGNGSYRSMPGDHSLLRKIGSSFVLLDADGIMRTFDSAGRFAQARDIHGNGVDLAYDASGRLVTITHTNGWTVTLAYDGSGHLTSATDPFGRAVTYAYAGGFLTRVTWPGGRYISYEYDTTAGDTAGYALTAIVGMDGHRLTYAYDGIGRLVAIKPDGQAATQVATDAAGHVQITSPNGEMFVLTPDDLGRFGLARDPLGRTSSLVFDDDDNPTTITDEAGHRTAATWGPVGNLITAKDASGATASLGWVYPPGSTAPRNTSLTDRNDHVSLFHLDGSYEVVGLTYPDGSTETMERDSNGLITAATNRRGQRAQYGYDSFGRVVSKVRPDGTTATYGYDALGRLVQRGDGSGSFVAQLDPSGLLTQLTSPDGSAIAYGHDAAGRLSSVTYPDGYYVLYEVDSAGRLGDVKDGSGTTLLSFQYDGAGRLVKETKGNGTATTYAYGALGRLSTITQLSPGGITLDSFSYTYDAVGNVLSATSSAGTSAFEYDAVDRLTQANLAGGEVISVTYDAAGNRVQVVDGGLTTAYTHDAQNRTLQAGSETFAYDEDGNLVSRTGSYGTISYGWDGEGQLVRVNHPTLGATVYGYDVLGRRTSETTGSTITRIAYDGATPIAEYDGSGKLVARYVYAFGLSARVAADGTTAYYGFDGAGNTRLVTDSSGAVANKYAYTPWGVATAVTETVPNPFRFAGRAGVRTSPVGHVMMNARAYDPGLGRFLSIDALRYGAALNLYQYANDNPLRWSDPSGRISQPLGAYLTGKAINVVTTALGVKLGNSVVFNIINVALNHGVSIKDIIYAMKNDKTTNQVVLDAIQAYGDQGMTDFGALAPGAVEGLAGGVVKELVGNPVLMALAATAVITLETDMDACNDFYDKSNKIDEDHHPYVLQNRYGWLHQIYGPNIPKGALEVYPLQPKPTMDGVTPGDPNGKLATPGAGPRHVVKAGTPLTFTVFFQNVPTASAPAQEVVVTDPLDGNLDWSTLRLTEVVWGDTCIPISGGGSSFATRVEIPDYRPGDARTWWVDVTAEQVGGQLNWTFRTLDPATNDLPDDALAGFLPPDDATGRGEGQVSFTVNSMAGLATGTHILNSASIVFDQNAAIATNQTDNVIGLGGDANDDGAVNPGDVFYLVNYFFGGGPAPPGLADCNGDGEVSILDIFYLINYLYAGGPAPVD